MIPIGDRMTYRALIAMWPRTRAFARDAGVSPDLVRQWRHRERIPARYWMRILAGAKWRGIAVSADMLTEMVRE